MIIIQNFTYRSHKVAQNPISLIALRTSPTSPRSRHVDAVHPGVDAAAAVVAEALVDVVAVEPVAAVARGTGTAPINFFWKIKIQSYICTRIEVASVAQLARAADL